MTQSIKENNVYIFIDEFGTPALNIAKNGTTTHFIYSAILINESELNKAREIRENISKKYFQGQDIKSNHLGEKNNEKRINILKDLNQLKYFIWTFVVDKKEIKKNDNGLKFKNIFIKYFQKILIQKINKNIKNCLIYFDKTGYPEFQKSLSDFINNKVVNYDLFDKTFYEIKDDKNEKLLQIADLIVNTCGHIFSESHKNKDRQQFYDLIKSNIKVDYFPEKYNKIEILNIYQNKEENKEKNKEDINIINCAILSINNFKEKYNNYTNKKEKIAISIEILDYLYTEYNIDKNTIITTYELTNYIKNNYNLKYSEYKIREIIQFLRDEGVLIVSPLEKKGYKIPNTKNDVVDSFNRIVSNIAPMIKRVDIMNTKITIFTQNKINILNEYFTNLKDLVEISNRPLT